MQPESTAPPTARQLKRRAATVQRLLPIVEELLGHQDSYLDLNVEQIIERDGMARSTFYRYFDDKADLLVGLSETVMAEILGAAQAMWELPADASRAALASSVRHTIDTYRPHTVLMSALAEVAAYHPTAKAQFQAGFAAAQSAAAAHIRAGQAAGFVRPELDPEETAGWLTWMAERGMNQLVPGAPDATLRRLVRSFTAILWFTLYEGQGRPEA
jgi:AcrR family transcriptional regulator